MNIQAEFQQRETVRPCLAKLNKILEKSEKLHGLIIKIVNFATEIREINSAWRHLFLSPFAPIV